MSSISELDRTQLPSVGSYTQETASDSRRIEIESMSGYVELTGVLGSDSDICRNARVSRKAESGNDESLIKFMLDNGHTTPFEFAELQFRVRCPIFVIRQWIRHRTGSFVETSLRYCKINENDFTFPKDSFFRTLMRDPIETPGHNIWNDRSAKEVEAYFRAGIKLYNRLIDEYGQPKEIARIVLPLWTPTEFVWSTDLHNLIHFLELRLDKTAQKDIRLYANAVYELSRNAFPITFRNLCLPQIS